MEVARRIKQLGSETLIYGISGTIGRFIGIFLVPLYTRAYSPTDYGYISILTALTTLLSTFIILGLDMASARWYYDDADPQRQRRVMSSWFWCQTAAGLAVTAMMILFARPIAGRLLDSPAQASLVVLTALTIPLTTFSKVLGNWLRYQRRAWTAMTYFTLSALATIGLVVLFVLVWRRGVAGLFYGQIASGTLSALAAILLMRRWLAPGHVSHRLLREMLLFGLPLVPAGVAAWITASADRFILKGFSVPASEIGIYSIGVALASGVALVTGGFTMAWGPFAFSILSEPAAKRIYAKVWSLYALAGCLLATALSLFAPLLLQIFTQPAYYTAASTVPWLAFGYLATGATYIAALGANIAKKSVPVAISIFLGAGVNTLLNLLLIPRLGKEGAAIATGVAYCATVAYLYVMSQRNYPIPYRPADAVICLGFSAALLVADHLLLPPDALWAYAVRLGMCLLFVPLAFALGILRPDHVRIAAESLRRRKGRTAGVV